MGYPGFLTYNYARKSASYSMGLLMFFDDHEVFNRFFPQEVYCRLSDLIFLHEIKIIKLTIIIIDKEFQIHPPFSNTTLIFNKNADRAPENSQDSP